MIDFDWLNDFDLLDIGLAGAMSEEMAEEAKSKQKERREEEEGDDVV